MKNGGIAMKTMIIFANGLEECEALVTYDLLYRAGIETDIIGLEDEIISSHNVKIIPHKNIKDIDPLDYDCLILPGGMPGTLNLENNEMVQSFIDLFIEKDRYIAAICAAPSILAHKGLLENGKFIVHPGFEGDLKPIEGKICQDGKIITGRSLGAVFEFAQLIIKNLLGEEKAQWIFEKILY